MKLSRITVETISDGKTSRKGYDIDHADFFWKKNASKPFPQVAEGRNTLLIVLMHRHRPGVVSI